MMKPGIAAAVFGGFLLLAQLLATPAGAVVKSLGTGGAGLNAYSGAKAKKLCLYGDSITAQSDTVNAGVYSAQTSQSYGTWLNVYTGYRVYRSPQTNNFGVSGDTTTMMLARIGAVSAAGCDMVVMNGGTNDVNGNAGCSAITANLRAIVNTLLAAGTTVVDTTIFPRSGGLLWNAALTAQALCVNSWRREFARGSGSDGYYLVDLDPVMTDPTSATWAVLAGYLADGVHPSSLGASAMAAAIAATVNALAPPWLAPQLTASDAYDATNNPRGNHVLNPAMTGTAGAIGTCTGQTPNGFSVASTPFTTAAGTCALSVQTLTNGVRALQAVLGGTMTSPQNLDVQVVLSTPGNFVTGDVIRGLFWVNLGATNTNIAALNPFIAVTTNAVISYHMAFDTPPEGIPAAGFPTTGGITYPMGGKNWVPMLSDEYTIPAGPVTQIYIDLRLGSKAAGAIASTMQTCCWEVRKVVP